MSHFLRIDFEIGRIGFVVDGLLQFKIRHLLYGLGVLQFLDEFHLKHLHLHDLGFFLSDHLFLFGNLSGDVLASLMHFPDSKLLDLHLLVLHLFVLQASFHLVLLLLLRVELLQTSLSLIVYELSLLCLLALVHDNCVFYFVLLSVPFFT